MAVTRLTRPVRRKAEAYVVTIRPEGREAIVEVREVQRRKGFEITLGVLYRILGSRAAEQLVAQRKAERVTRRIARQASR
jgi:hypothetical protein